MTLLTTRTSDGPSALRALVRLSDRVHAIWLPSKGINGWTGEPKDKYYELRGWPKPG